MGYARKCILSGEDWGNRTIMCMFKSMDSSAIWKKHACTSEFFKDDQNCTSPKGKSLKMRECLFSQIAAAIFAPTCNGISDREPCYSI